MITEVKYQISTPRDTFVFWDLVGKLADALARLSLEDPSNPLPKNISMNMDGNNYTIWLDCGALYYKTEKGVKYYVLRTKGDKTIVVSINEKANVPVEVVLADTLTSIDDLPDEILEQALEQ